MVEMPNEIAERIVDAHWNGGGKGVEFTNIHQFNACNHRMAGTIDVDGEVFGFIVRSGDWGGFEVENYGKMDDVDIYTYDAPPESRFTFAPTDDNLKENNPMGYALYVYWTAQEWFREKLRNYHYDRHFQPGCAIEKAYRDWAAEKGMKIVHV